MAVCVGVPAGTCHRIGQYFSELQYFNVLTRLERQKVELPSMGLHFSWPRARAATASILNARGTLSLSLCPRLTTNQFQLPVLLPQVGYGILEENWVQTHVGAHQWHCSEYRSECVDACLSLYEVVGVVPGSGK